MQHNPNQATLFAGFDNSERSKPESAAPYQSHSDTSEAAAADILDTATSLKAQVYQAITDWGRAGATDEQVQHQLAMNPSTQRPRRVELVKEGMVVDSGRKRKTVSRRNAVVWVAKKFAPLGGSHDG